MAAAAEDELKTRLSQVADLHGGPRRPLARVGCCVRTGAHAIDPWCWLAGFWRRRSSCSWRGLPFIYVLVIGFFTGTPFAADPTAFSPASTTTPARLRRAVPHSLWLTLKFAFFAVVSEIVLGYLLAQLFMREFPVKGLFRTIHTLPLIVAPIAVGAIWRLLTVPGLGPLPYYLDAGSASTQHRQLSPTRRSRTSSWTSGTGRRWSR